MLEVVEAEPIINPRHRLTVEHNSRRDLGLRSSNQVRERSRQVGTVARPQPDRSI